MLPPELHRQVVEVASRGHVSGGDRARKDVLEGIDGRQRHRSSWSPRRGPERSLVNSAQRVDDGLGVEPGAVDPDTPGCWEDAGSTSGCKVDGRHGPQWLGRRHGDTVGPCPLSVK